MADVAIAPSESVRLVMLQFGMTRLIGFIHNIVALATNSQLRIQMCAVAWTSSKSYDIRSTVAETVELYEQLLCERPDLQRARNHSHWFRPYNRWRAKLRNFVSKIRPEDATGLASLRGRGD